MTLAALVSSAARVCGSLVVGSGVLLVAACAGAPSSDAPAPQETPQAPRSPRLGVHTAQPPPSATERYCAWYGDARDSTLYFGQSAFWSASAGVDGKRGDRPRADLDLPGPVLVGRFDLRRGQLLDPLDVGRPEDHSGVWDVLAHESGKVFFTTYFESAGWVDPRSGASERLDALGKGLNELSPGPYGSILATRYGSGDGAGNGSVVVIGPRGELLAEHPLQAPAGYTAAAKTAAQDTLRGEIWVTTDLLPAGGGEIRHDTYVLDVNGREKKRISSPEIQFVRFAADGTGYFAELDGRALSLRVVPPDRGRSWKDPGSLVLLDGRFPSAVDFAQDVQVAPDGRVLVTRWSGWVHVVDPAGNVQDVKLPKVDEDGIYYTSILYQGDVCATHCADVTVVCKSGP